MVSDPPVSSVKSLERSASTSLTSHGSQLPRTSSEKWFLILDRRKYVEEDLIANLQGQISTLESQLRQYHQSHEMRHGSLERSNQVTSNMRIEFQHVGIDQSTSTPYAKTMQDKDWNSTPALAPGYQTADVRSQSAMEELASLMLSMDLEGQGEPSFTLPPGKGKPKQKEASPNSERLWQESATDGLSTLTLETRKQLVDCFMRQFNIFHRFLEAEDVESIVMQHVGTNRGDTKFRNYALLSVGARLSDRSDSLELSSSLAGSAEGMVLQCIRQQSSDLVCQGLSLLAWRELVIGNDSMAYNYIGLFHCLLTCFIIFQLLAIPANTISCSQQWLQALFFILDFMSLLSVRFLPPAVSDQKLSPGECGHFGRTFQ
jgi:hypothetical protein